MKQVLISTDRSAFWSGFADGLASPVNVFADPKPYDSTVIQISPSQGFAAAGAFIGAFFAQGGNESSRGV